MKDEAGNRCILHFAALILLQTGGESGTRTRTGLSARRASNAVPYQLGDLSKWLSF
jgi:hypothetical protein